MALTDKDLQRMSEIRYRERIVALEEENEKKAVFIAYKNTKLAEWRKENERLKKQMQTIIAQFAHDDEDYFDDWLACMEETIRETAEML